MSTQNQDEQPRGLTLTRDLLFSTKITGTARALGLEMDVAATVDDLLRRVGETSYACILLDLSLADVSVAEVLESLGQADGSRPKIVAFGSHVDTARLAEAEAAGCDEVMPRSQFSGTLPELLGRLMGSDRSE